MHVLLYICILSTILLLFLLVYSSTLHLFPNEWRNQVNSNNKSLNPKVNNDSITGLVIIILAAVMSVMWSTYFYIGIFY